ncbi:AAA family ATPase [Peptostreptococcus faecalis]|uniref:AAA family ATPase n=1 Tax=Peptostreptococcus faecalis TaxID=2045015 RepID=UPI000C7C92DF|nr:AAA family ATPase [Peptostreptococcus faecalis]
MIFIKSIFFDDKINEKISENKYDSYEVNIPIIKNMINNKEKIEISNEVTFFVGENGSGKSTLLEAIAIAYGFNPEGGTKNFNFSTKDSHSNLFDHLMLSKSFKLSKDGFFYRAESFYNVSTEIDNLDNEFPLLDYYGGKSLHDRSHGEGLLELIKNRFLGNGVYILDEPEASLSPTGLMQLLCLIKEFVTNDSQFIISTHSPILMSYPNSTIYELKEGLIRKTNLKETDHYIITRAFMENSEVMIKNLFSE